MTSDVSRDQHGNVLSFSEREKRKLEREAARLFMRAYERCFQQEIRHIWHNEPAKPDISCYLNGAPLDLEIAHLYASEQEARIATGYHYHAGNIGGERYQGCEHLWHFLADLAEMNSEEKLAQALTRIISNKAKKQYDSERVWLVIRNASPLWDHEEFVRAQKVSLPASHPFEQIWLLTDLAGNQPLLRLTP